MQKKLVFIASIIIIAFLLSLFLPWYAVAIAAFLVAFLFKTTSWQAFYLSFLAVALLWVVWALVKNMPNHSLLASKVSVLIFKKQITWAVFLITAIIGGLTAGFGGLTGNFLRGAINK